MFIQQLFEGEIKRVIAIYPGRFQPFHLGHKEVFETLQAKFGTDNVFIGTSNKTDAVKSPFNFSDKLQLMTAAGVNNHHVIEVSSPYMPDDYIRAIGFNPEETVLIFAVGAPDLKRLEVDAHYTALTPTGRPSKIPDGKSVGDPKPFKTFKSLQDCETADQHQYVLIVNEREKKVTVNGKDFDASHGTQVRALWNEVRNDPKASAQVLQQLYGRATPEIAHIFNKIPDANATPAPAPAAAPKLKTVKQPLPAKDLSEFAPPGSGDDGNDGFSDETLKRLAAQWWQGDEDPRIEKTLMAAGWEIGQDEGYNNGGVFVVQAGDINGNSYISWPAEELESLGEGAIITKDQLVDIYIKGKGKNNMPIQKKVGAEIPNSKVNAFIAAIADKYGLNPKAFVYGPSNRMSEDAAGVGVVASKKQKNDPRYSMSMTKDVGPGELKKNMKKLHLEGNDYEHGFADPNAPQLGANAKTGAKRAELQRELGHEQNNLAIAINGKVWKVIPGKGYADSKEEYSYLNNMKNWAAKKSASSGKKWTVHLTGASVTVDESFFGSVKSAIGPWFLKKDGDVLRTVNGQPFTFKSKEEAVKWAMKTYKVSYNQQNIIPTTNPDKNLMTPTGAVVSEGTGPVTHRIGLTVTDPNHPMVSKRDETYHKTVRVTGDDREKAINGAIAHARRKGYKVHDHHYLGTVDQGMAEATGDPKFDKMLKGITGKRQVAKQQKADTKQQARDAFGGMFGGGNPADKLSIRKKGVAEGKKPDNYHIVDKDGKPASLASYADKTSAEKDRDAKHPGAEVRQVGPRGKVKGVSEELNELSNTDQESYYRFLVAKVKTGRTLSKQEKEFIKTYQFYKMSVAEGLPQTLRKVVPGYAKREIDKKMDAEKFGRTDVDRDANYYRYKKIQDKIKEQGMAEGLNENAEELSVGDPVIITGQGIEFEGKTGDIDSFGDMKRFVVVNLYNHGRHSFHSSDVSYNDHADKEDDLDEDLYQYDKEDPYNSEFAPRAGMGRMTLRGWKQSLIRRTAELAQQMSVAGQDIDKAALWDHVYAKLKSMNMDPIAQEIEQAQAELEKIRRRGGVRSRAFNK